MSKVQLSRLPNSNLMIKPRVALEGNGAKDEMRQSLASEKDKERLSLAQQGNLSMAQVSEPGYEIQHSEPYLPAHLVENCIPDLSAYFFSLSRFTVSLF